ncbi:MAG: hypothetical protein AAB910_03200 [Patescibacteria group bacterium]
MNIFGIFLMLIAPVAGPGWAVFVIAAVATVTSYRGLHRHTVYGLLAVLFGIELIYGLDVGVLSLSYLAAVLVLALVRRLIVIPLWISAGGWHASDALRAFSVACGICAVMASGGVMAAHLLYGYPDSVARLQNMFVPQNIAWAAIAVALILVILRRADEPFRRHISFGI